MCARTTARTVALLLALLCASGARADDADEIDGTTPAVRVNRTMALEKTDPGAVATAFRALGERKFKKGEAGPHLDFLAAYVVQQKSRALRLAALEAGARIDAPGLATRIRGTADGEDRLKSALAAEALGLVGSADEDRAKLRELTANPSQSIAVRACDALARIGEKDDAEALVETALTTENIEVSDHATWAALDIYKKEKTLLARLKRAGGKDDGGPRAIRRASIEAMLADAGEPFKWEPSLEKVRELLANAPATIVVNCADSDRQKKIEATLAWLREKMPAAHLLVRAAVASIDWPGNLPDAQVDLEKHAICIPLSYSGQNERQLAYHVLRVATVLFDQRIGHPCTGHRGWEDAIFDTYDLCEIAGLYSAGRVNRDQFLETIIAQRPWGGN